MNSCRSLMLLIWMPNNADSTCRKVGKKLKQPALPAIITHCGSKSARIAPLNTLTDSYIRFCRKNNLISIQWFGNPNPYHTILHYRCTPCFNTLLKSVRYLITSLEYSLFYYIVELYTTFLLYWATPNPNISVRYSISNYIAELYPTLVHCRTMADLNMLLSAFEKLCRLPNKIELNRTW